MPNITNITLSFPNWFYVTFSVGFVCFIFYLGCNWKSLRSICREFPKIRRALDLISQKLLDKGFFSEQVYTSSASPLNLTPAGRKILEDSEFEEFFKANKQLFFLSITRKNPQSPFDVEKATKELMLYLNTEKIPKIELVENYAYREGRAILDVFSVYAIEIRDRYLKEIYYPSLKKKKA